MISIIKTPTYNVFVQHLFDNHIITWNPTKHEDWELPPSWILETYFELFPVKEKSEVVNFISRTSEKRIMEYFKFSLTP